MGETVIRQLRGADLLVLNKVDLVSPDDLDAVRAWLAGVAPESRIVETTYGQVPLEILFGAHGERSHDGGGGENDHAAAGAGGHERQQMYETRNLSNSEPIREADLRAFVAGLPVGILRAKGFVYLAEDPDHRYLLQLVGKRWTLKADLAWSKAEPETRVVLIGLPGSIAETKLKMS